MVFSEQRQLQPIDISRTVGCNVSDFCEDIQLVHVNKALLCIWASSWSNLTVNKAIVARKIRSLSNLSRGTSSNRVSSYLKRGWVTQ